MSKGDRSSEVKAIQTFLQSKKIYNGKLHGIFDVPTEQAIKKYQKSKGIKADGIVGTLTWRRMKAEK